MVDKNHSSRPFEVKKGEMEKEKEKQKQKQVIVLTQPLSLEGGLAAEHLPPNVIQRVLSLFRNIRPGSDLTHFQLSPLFNMPKSQLQCYGEAVYCINEDILSKCAKGKSSLERFTSIVAWSISTTRPAIFGLAPFNPILGETHHVSKGSLNILLEQVSHHPPVSALHATDAEHGIELLWCQRPVPKFNGITVDAVVDGKRLVKLLGHGETYEMNSPNLVIRLLPVPGTEWSGNVRLQCEDTGLAADIFYYRSQSFLGFGGKPRSVKGRIFDSKSLKTIYEIEGQWDRTVTLKDANSGNRSVLYDAIKAISQLKPPVLKDPKGVEPSESAAVWGEVSQSILSRNWEKAREVKTEIEEKERKLTKERKSMGEPWSPRYFTSSKTKEDRWECWPKQQSVPPAPIIQINIS